MTEGRLWGAVRYPMLMLAALLIAGCSALVEIAVDTDPGTAECEGVDRVAVANWNEDRNPFRPSILEISSVREVSRTGDSLRCAGVAELSNCHVREVSFGVREADGGRRIFASMGNTLSTECDATSPAPPAATATATTEWWTRTAATSPPPVTAAASIAEPSPATTAASLPSIPGLPKDLCLRGLMDRTPEQIRAVQELVGAQVDGIEGPETRGKFVAWAEDSCPRGAPPSTTVTATTVASPSLTDERKGRILTSAIVALVALDEGRGATPPESKE